MFPSSIKIYLKSKLFLYRSFGISNKLNGYIVLVPEIGEFKSSDSGQIDGLPEFSSISVEKCLAAVGSQARTVEKLVHDSEALIQKNGQIDIFSNLFYPLEHAIADLETTWGVAKTLYLGSSSLMPTKYYLNIHERAQRARSARFNSKLIFDCLSAVNCTAINGGKQEDQKLVKKYLLEGQLNGINLRIEEKEKLASILTELNEEKNSFRNKVEAATNHFSHMIRDYSLVRAFPSTLLQAIAVNEEEPTKGPWKVNLRSKIVKGVLEYCPDRTERWNLWQADVRKASIHNDKSLSNSIHIENIRSLRKRQSNILGFPDFATMSMETKMSEDVAYVKDTLKGLLRYAFPAQVHEMATLQKFANECGFQHKLEMCDILYWKRKYLKAVYNYDEEQIREYFPLPRVLTGVFHLLEKLFHITIVERENTGGWHTNVKYYDIYEASDQKEHLGGFYLDCYTQKGQKGNEGWMVAIKNRSEIAQSKPLCSLIFNFPAPVYGKPYLLSFEDLQIVFKIFGKSMQHILTKVGYSDLAGLSNIEWDAAEVGGNIMEFFLNDPDVLVNISGHYCTEEGIPPQHLNSIKSYRTFMAGYELCKELYIAGIDLELNTSTEFWQDVVKGMWPKYLTLEMDKKDSHLCSMTDIISGEWSAAYFSHIISKLVAADVYSAFLENDASDVGKRLKNSFFACGGSIGTAEIFRRFRGRDLSPHALVEALDFNTKIVDN